MIEEILAGARREDGLARRWYSSESIDLYTWRESTHEIVQFQLFWKRPTQLHDGDHIPEEALTWTRETGFAQAQVSNASRYKAPILSGNISVPLSKFVQAFTSQAADSTYPDVQFVLRKLHEERR